MNAGRQLALDAESSFLRSGAQLEDYYCFQYCVPMATSVEKLIEQAMTLPSESRAQLADLLVESLDKEDLGRIDSLWMAEAKRRRDEVRTGLVETIPGEEALRKVRDRQWPPQTEPSNEIEGELLQDVHTAESQIDNGRGISHSAARNKALEK